MCEGCKQNGHLVKYCPLQPLAPLLSGAQAQLQAQTQAQPQAQPTPEVTSEPATKKRKSAKATKAAKAAAEAEAAKAQSMSGSPVPNNGLATPQYTTEDIQLVRMRTTKTVLDLIAQNHTLEQVFQIMQASSIPPVQGQQPQMTVPGTQRPFLQPLDTRPMPLGNSGMQLSPLAAAHLSMSGRIGSTSSTSHQYNSPIQTPTPTTLLPDAPVLKSHQGVKTPPGPATLFLSVKEQLLAESTNASIQSGTMGDNTRVVSASDGGGDFSRIVDGSTDGGFPQPFDSGTFGDKPQSDVVAFSQVAAAQDRAPQSAVSVSGAASDAQTVPGADGSSYTTSERVEPLAAPAKKPTARGRSRKAKPAQDGTVTSTISSTSEA